jgi:TonB family protein
MNSRFVPFASFLALGLAGCAHAALADDVSSLAGVYSSAHPVTVNGVKVQTNGYIEIDGTGRITAFEQEGEGPHSAGSGCYLLAIGTATNAGLQGRSLTIGVSPRGDTVYQTLAGDSDTFGILAEPASNAGMRWFFHSGPRNSTVTINGNSNVVNSTDGASYSISGPALASPTPDQLRSMICHADNGSNPVAAGGAVAPQAPPVSIPPALQEAVDEAAMQKLGVAPDSKKAGIVLRWGKKIATDPDIRQMMVGRSQNLPAAGTPDVAAKAQLILDGVLAITPEQRSRMIELNVKILDGMPADCGGLKNLSAISKRYAIPILSEDDLEDYFALTFAMLKQSALHAPLAHVTDEERQQGEQAVMNKLGALLKSNPDGAHDLAALVVNSQAMTPTQWCNASRLSQRAVIETPEPFRDWAMIGRAEATKHLAAQTLGRNMPALSPASAPDGVQSYAERVIRRVRPRLVWSGDTQDLETVVAVHCLPTGTITSAAVVRSSGNQDWDAAALRAVQSADPMPVDTTGRAPGTFLITLRPAG